ncbi:MAG: hypothetical protein ACRDTD_17540 [Pseudonocardiaceae bacterium]
MTILFTRLASYLQAVRGKRMKGLAQLDAQDHTVIPQWHLAEQRIAGSALAPPRRQS